MLIRPKAVVFDWDNTLVDTWNVIHEALVLTFEEFGLKPWSISETKENVRASARDSFPALFGKQSENAKRYFYRTFEHNHLKALEPLEGAERLLQHLKVVNSPFVSVLSNKRGDLLRREIAHLGWDDYFDTTVGAQDAAIDKPARPALEAALEGSGLGPGPEVWLVGDTDIDMICAVQNSCYAVLLRPSPAGPGEFDGCEPDAFYPSCDALLEHFSSL